MKFVFFSVSAKGENDSVMKGLMGQCPSPRIFWATTAPVCESMHQTVFGDQRSHPLTYCILDIFAGHAHISPPGKFFRLRHWRVKISNDRFKYEYVSSAAATF